MDWKRLSYFFHTPQMLIDSLLNQYPGELRVVVPSQATDLAAYLSSTPAKIQHIHSIYIQGQAATDGKGYLLPDNASYNLREDMEAAHFLFSFQDQVPFILLGKYAAYPMAYTREEMIQTTQKLHKAGDYIQKAAEMGLACFLQRDSATFYRVFGIPDSILAKEALQAIDKISNPYDLLTVIAMDRPELFHITETGKHKLIGMHPGESYFRDSVKLKKLLLMECE